VSDFEGLDYYELLGVSRSAQPEEIKRAYRQEISRYHPDRFVNASPAEQEYASRRSQRLTEAYAVLSDLAARSAYNRGQTASRGDTKRRAPPPQPRDHQAELYEQARAHLAADRPLQAIGALRQLQKLNPFYRDSADLLADAEAQLQARQARKSGRRARRPLILAGVLFGGMALLAFVVLANRINAGVPNTAGEPEPTGAATAAIAIAASRAPSEPPAPTLTPPAPSATAAPAPTVPPTVPPTAPPPPTAVPTAIPTVPAPTVTELPIAVAAGKLLFADNFSNGGWADSAGAGWRVGYQRGRYHIAVDPGYGTIWSFRTMPARDINVGVDVRVASSEGGLLLRFLDANNYLSFSVNPQQTSYRLEQHRGGAVTALAGGQTESIQAGASNWNRLVARLRGDHLQLLANGQLLTELDLPDAPNSPRYGLLAIANDRSAEVFFDNLEIRELQ
jgi:curved DNA-binding protein CbpA